MSFIAVWVFKLILGLYHGQERTQFDLARTTQVDPLCFAQMAVVNCTGTYE